MDFTLAKVLRSNTIRKPVAKEVLANHAKKFAQTIVVQLYVKLKIEWRKSNNPNGFGNSKLMNSKHEN